MLKPGRTRLLLYILAGVVFFAAALGIVVVLNGVQYSLVRGAFEVYLWRDRSEIKKEVRSGESNVYYFTSYYLHGMLSAVEATDSQRLLKRTLRYLDRMLATQVEITYRGASYRVWGPFNVTPSSPVEKPNVHYTLQAAVPLARAAAIIKSNPRFAKRHGAQADAYIAFVKSAVFDLWYKTEYRHQVPWINVEYVPIWNDNATNMGLCAVFMYQATGDPFYGDIATKVGEAFRVKLTPTGRAWIWESNTIPIGSDTDNTPGSVGNQAGVPDTSHANREAMFVAFLHESNLVFKKEEVERMAFTLLDSIWDQSLDAPSFSNYINGSNKPYRVYMQPGLNGPIYHGWSLLGGYSAEVQNVLFHTWKAIVKGRTNPALIRNATGYGGMLGLTGHMLRNYKLLNEKDRP